MPTIVNYFVDIAGKHRYFVDTGDERGVVMLKFDQATPAERVLQALPPIPDPAPEPEPQPDPGALRAEIETLTAQRDALVSEVSELQVAKVALDTERSR